MGLYLGIDIGTSGVRAIAVDDDGATRARAGCELALPVRAGPAVSQSPSLWWDAVRLAVSRLLVQIDRHAVQAIAVDGTSGTVLVTDSRGMPLSTGLMYNDTRAVAQIEAIDRVAPASSAARGTGSALARLLYLQAQHPDARHAVHQADWIAGMLSGNHGVSDENNALKLGYDPAARRWPEWLSTLGVRNELLPRVFPPGVPIDRIDAKVAHDLGLPASALVVSGTTDGVAAFLATGAHRVGDAVTSLGSTLVVKVLCNKSVFAPEYGIYSHRLDEAWLVGGASNTGGSALLKFFDAETMRNLTPRLRPDMDTGLDYYPLPDVGERFPVDDPQRISRTTPRPEDDALFFQGLLEGIASVEMLAYRRLATMGAPYPTAVRTIGGGAANHAWTQIRARRLGVPMCASTATETAYGAALLARRGAAHRANTA